ncbi:2-dehydro-3-deoxygalactonokinase [Vibrio sp. M260112]|uniref:2-dehydro-3-deoxygalactonokinase n=1 Tax=Vibrio sp. M260112 TaxID=3020895 RepID=UPI002F400087
MGNTWIAVDWGTTNFRAFLMNENCVCIEERSAELGLLSVTDKKFSQALKAQLGDWLNLTTNIYMAGMVGSKQGWVEAKYVALPATPEQFLQHSVAVQQDWASSVKIVAGATCLNACEQPDVMRGEEVQLIGLSRIANQNNFSAILPGTHSKHAVWRDGKLESFATYMTGELFSLLKTHSILGLHLGQQSLSEKAFHLGLKLGYGHSLNSVLFSARTNRLFEKIAEQDVLEYLSGLLIGNELSHLNREEKHYIIGSKSLSDKYSKALDFYNYQYEIVSGQTCFLEGMHQFYLLDLDK